MIFNDIKNVRLNGIYYAKYTNDHLHDFIIRDKIYLLLKLSLHILAKITTRLGTSRTERCLDSVNVSKLN